MRYLAALKNEIGLFLVVVLASTLLVGAVYLYRESLLEERALSEIRLKSIQDKYQQAKERKRLMEEYREKFALLEEKDIIGDENRLNWIDLLERTVQKEQIPFVEYRINRQQPLKDRKLLSRFPNIDVYQSPMTLDMRLLHEGDLFTLMRTLDNRARGLFDIEKCNIERSKVTRTNTIDSGTDSNFRASCSLNWYSFRPKDS